MEWSSHPHPERWIPVNLQATTENSSLSTLLDFIIKKTSFSLFIPTLASLYLRIHLADAFIQSDLHCIQVTVSTFYQLLLSLGIEPMILALLAPCSIIWAIGKINHLYLFEQCLRLGITSTSSVCLPLQDELLHVFSNCKSFWIKASAKCKCKVTLWIFFPPHFRGLNFKWSCRNHRKIDLMIIFQIIHTGDS